jgi:hypothetical protein
LGQPLLLQEQDEQHRGEERERAQATVCST